MENEGECVRQEERKRERGKRRARERRGKRGRKGREGPDGDPSGTVAVGKREGRDIGEGEVRVKS
jgi:hypothetical protein